MREVDGCAHVSAAVLSQRSDRGAGPSVSESSGRESYERKTRWIIVLDVEVAEASKLALELGIRFTRAHTLHWRGIALVGLRG